MSQEFVEQLVWSLVKKCALRVKEFFKTGKKTEKPSPEVENNEEVKEAVENIGNGEEELKVKNSEETQKTTVKNNENVDGEDENRIDVDSESNKTESGSDDVEIEASETNREESSKEVPMEKEEKAATSLDTAIFFHFTLFLLWSLVAGLCIPSVLTWAQNFR